MPLFDFHCSSCDKTFEILVRSDTVPTCPQCGSTAVDKCVSKPSEPGKSKGIIAAGRAAAAREGHFSNYSSADRKRARG
jgi:putative FmdB family regulatory protein